MAKRRSPLCPGPRGEATFRQIINGGSSFASALLIPLDDGIDWPGHVPDDEETLLRKQVTAYQRILEFGFQMSHVILSQLLVRPVRMRIEHLPDDSPDRMETACGVFSARGLLRQYHEDEQIDATPAGVALNVAELIDIPRVLGSHRELVGANRTTSRPTQGEMVPFADWPCDQVITLGYWVESSWALVIQTMISRLAEVVVPRPDLMDAAPTVKWLAAAAQNVRNIVPPYEQWESCHLEPTDIARRSLGLECDRWLAERARPPEDDDYGLPMSREEVARRYFGDPNLRFRKISEYPAIMKRIRDIPGNPNKVQFHLRGLPPEIRARFTIDDWQSISPPAPKSR